MGNAGFFPFSIFQNISFLEKRIAVKNVVNKVDSKWWRRLFHVGPDVAV